MEKTRSKRETLIKDSEKEKNEIQKKLRREKENMEK